MNDRIKIGYRLAEIRIEKGMSQAELADKTGLKQQNIARIENGLYSTGIDILSKIARALDYRIDIVKK